MRPLMFPERFWNLENNEPTDTKIARRISIFNNSNNLISLLPLLPFIAPFRDAS